MSDGYVTVGVDDPFRQQCYVTGTVRVAAGTEKPKNGNTEKPESTPAVSVAEESSIWDSFTFWPRKVKFGGAVGCGGESGPVVKRIEDGGINMVPPKAPDGDADGGETTDSGAVIYGPVGTANPKDWGNVILHTDPNGEIILPDDIWFSIEGEGGFFQETPWILVESGDIIGQGLQDLTLVVEFGTDSTKIEAGMGCFDGLINVNKLSQEEIDQGLGCPEDGYKQFAVCPSDSNNRLTLYLAGYQMEGYRYASEDECVDGGKIKEDCFKTTEDGSDLYFKKIGENGDTSITSVEQLYTNPDAATKVGVVCGDKPNPNVYDIPTEYNADGRLYLKLKLQKIVDARPADQNAHYETRLRIKIKPKGN